MPPTTPATPRRPPSSPKRTHDHPPHTPTDRYEPHQHKRTAPGTFDNEPPRPAEPQLVKRTGEEKRPPDIVA
jgi:hypothetical protein